MQAARFRQAVQPEIRNAAIARQAFAAVGVGSVSHRRTAAAARVAEVTIAQIQGAIIAKQITSVQLVNFIGPDQGLQRHLREGAAGDLGVRIQTIAHAGQLNRADDAQPAPRLAPGAGLRRAQGAQHDRFADRRSGCRTPGSGSRAGPRIRPDRQPRRAATRRGQRRSRISTTPPICAPPEWGRCVLRQRSPAGGCDSREAAPRCRRHHSRQGEHGGVCVRECPQRVRWHRLRSSTSAASPNASSSGSGTVAANLVICAIAEESSSSIRGLAVANTSTWPGADRRAGQPQGHDPVWHLRRRVGLDLPQACSGRCSASTSSPATILVDELNCSKVPGCR